jgi:hypothetical protein
MLPIQTGPLLLYITHPRRRESNPDRRSGPRPAQPIPKTEPTLAVRRSERWWSRLVSRMRPASVPER